MPLTAHRTYGKTERPTVDSGKARGGKPFASTKGEPRCSVTQSYVPVKIAILSGKNQVTGITTVLWELWLPKGDRNGCQQRYQLASEKQRKVFIEQVITDGSVLLSLGTGAGVNLDKVGIAKNMLATAKGVVSRILRK